MQRVNIDSLEISIIRAAEYDQTKDNESIFQDESLDLDTDSEHSSDTQEGAYDQNEKTDSADSLMTLLEGKPNATKSNDDFDDFINTIINKSSSKPNSHEPSTPLERTSSYPLEYYLRSGTFSE